MSQAGGDLPGQRGLASDQVMHCDGHLLQGAAQAGVPRHRDPRTTGRKRSVGRHRRGTRKHKTCHTPL